LTAHGKIVMHGGGVDGWQGAFERKKWEKNKGCKIEWEYWANWEREGRVPMRGGTWGRN